MSFLGLLFSALTGAALALFYMLNKKASQVGKPLLVIFLIFVAHLPILLVRVMVAPSAGLEPAYFLPGLGVIALTVAGNLLTIRALSLSPFSLIVPVLGLSPVFASLISIVLLGEWPTGLQWTGIGLVVLGILWLYAPPEKPWRVFDFWPHFARERGAPYISMAALCWAACAPMDKLALSHAAPAFHAAFVFTGVVIVFTILMLTQFKESWPPIERKHWPLLAFTGTVGAFSYMMQLAALSYAAAGPFEAIKRVTGQLLALAIGYFLFQEKVTIPKIIGIVILCIGVPLIVL